MPSKPWIASKVVSKTLRVESGRWKVESGRWKVENSPSGEGGNGVSPFRIKPPNGGYY
ncbi:hypothetical protein DES36_12216 [Alkalibaculum bacchi]|uniref:Uncharacterized protein n=1 Tax=Alkalibaculum bacchi TaxID=645887 RepID=A0A366HXT4_9FIRM|nr:hypothetical protein DES36_12216 [Alkalibaculum bacchi]